MKTWRARNLNLQSFNHEFSHRLRFSEFTDGIYMLSIPMYCSDVIEEKANHFKCPLRR